MRRVVLKILFLIVIVGLGLLALGVGEARACLNPTNCKLVSTGCEWRDGHEYCGWFKECDCDDGESQDCGPGEYVCGSGCCDIDPGDGGGGECVDSSWSACVPSCGPGTQTSNCDTTQACNDGPCCTVTAPSGVTATDESETSVLFSWTLGSNGDSQRIMVDANAALINGDCVSGCLINALLSGSATSYSTGNVLAFSTNYTYKLFNIDSSVASCQAPTSGNFDHWMVADSWFQAEGGSLHADIGGVYSDIPQSCVIDLSCDEYLITNDANGQAGAVSFQGSLSLGSVVGGDNVSENGDDWNMETSYQGMVTGYNYFARLLEDDPLGINVWDGGLPGESGAFQGSITQTSGGDWNIGSGQAKVLLTDTDMVIRNNITVDEGGFLAIISSGSISVADDVFKIEGVYIADEDFNTCQSSTCGATAGTGDVSAGQLQAEGVFVGWGGVNLRRDFDSVDNNINPGEVFTYRPDLVTNAYRYLLRLDISWQEVAP